MGFLFIGNNRALDFVNTEKMQEGVRTDLLTAPADLARWLTEVGAGTEAAAVPDGAEGERVLGAARHLRAALREMAGELAEGRPAPAAALVAINDVLRRRAVYSQVERGAAEGYVRQEVVADRADTVGVVLAPIADAAADLLIAGEPSRVHKCESTRCILFFYDTSKNQTRRWCRMDGCGNRAKAAAHYARTRHGGSAEG